jgi:hypothetical protein
MPGAIACFGLALSLFGFHYKNPATGCMPPELPPQNFGDKRHNLIIKWSIGLISVGSFRGYGGFHRI